MAELEQKKVSNEKGLEVGDPELARLALQLQMTRSPGFDPLFREKLRTSLLEIVRRLPAKRILEEENNC